MTSIMDKGMAFVSHVWHLCNDMSPLLLLGFLLAGLMHEFMPNRFCRRFLADSSFRSVCFAALFGIPFPLCSCGVIPTAIGLRREGASRGATVSFLTATPQTGIECFTVSYSLLGLPFALIRPLVALVTAIISGTLINACVPNAANDESTPSVTEGMDECGEPRSFVSRLKAALHYGMIDMAADIGKWLVLGLLLAGVITTVVPTEWFAVFRENNLYSMLLILLLSIPMYFCATGSVPVAAALMAQGLTPGAALVLLMAGPASSLASILVIRNALGRRTVCIYLLSIIVCSVLFGLCIDGFLPAEWFSGSVTSSEPHMHVHDDVFASLCSILLIGILVYALFMHKAHHAHGDGCTCSPCSKSAEGEHT